MSDLLAQADQGCATWPTAPTWTRCYDVSTAACSSTRSRRTVHDVRVAGLDSHIPKTCDFWETVLFRAGHYRGSALHAHRHVHHRTPLSARHFVCWLTTWNNTIDEMHRGPIAEHAKVQAARIAWAMHHRLTGDDGHELDAVVAR